MQSAHLKDSWWEPCPPEIWRAGEGALQRSGKIIASDGAL